MIHCHLRGVECDCRPNECRAAPAKAAPLINFTAKEQFFAMAMLTLFMISISYGAFSSANEAYRKQALINQENVNVARR
ncbi:hypothetical protein G6L15_08360 [Agrobacterium rhizogenes]|uniref:hypothetical protein n=1 Tax=Rhizobium rhizogenes TaxID=359 RepID=UPI0015718CF0|nr:hypothetical protein [Rhizobium rhizogenes]NTG86157.1 hypothetical protein [Rhizobium rhizogenes]